MRKVIGPVEVYLVEDDEFGVAQPIQVLLRAPGEPALVWRLESASILLPWGEVQPVVVGVEPVDSKDLDP